MEIMALEVNGRNEKRSLRHGKNFRLDLMNPFTLSFAKNEEEEAAKKVWVFFL
jgi:hypothetical protein